MFLVYAIPTYCGVVWGVRRPRHNESHAILMTRVAARPVSGEGQITRTRRAVHAPTVPVC